MKETDLAATVIDWLSELGWDTFPEVQLRNRGPRADIVAIKNDMTWVIETKLSMNLHLMEQAIRWQELGALYVSMCIPFVSRRKAGKNYWHSRVVDNFCREKGIGLIFANPPEVFKMIPAKLCRYNYHRRHYILDCLDTRMKDYQAGSSSSEGYSTQRQRVLEDALQIIRQQPGCTLSDLVHRVKTNYRVRTKAKKYILRTLEQTDGVEVTHQGFEYSFKEQKV